MKWSVLETQSYRLASGSVIILEDLKVTAFQIKENIPLIGDNWPFFLSLSKQFDESLIKDIFK